jgi:hypothetical protein
MKLPQHHQEAIDVVVGASMHEVQVKRGHWSAVKNTRHHSDDDVLNAPLRQQAER